MADLLITIGTDSTQALNGLRQVAATATSTASTVNAAAASMAANAARAGGQIAIGSNQAGNALMNLGRVAQDAPFGFIGIQNNLNPLLESFQRLRTETGSAGGALRALGGSLIGAGGLGLALSVVTSAITFYTMWQQKAHKSTVDLTDKTKSYVDTLDSVRQAQLKGQQDGNSELTRLTLLYNATQNHKLSMDQRNLAYDELDKKYPKFFTNADRENTLLGLNSIGYENLAKSILMAANAKAFENKIGENANRAFEDQQKINDAIAQNKKAQATLDKGGNGGAIGGGTSDQASKMSDALDTITRNRKLIKDLYTDQTKLFNQTEQLKKLALESEIGASFKSGGELDDKPAKEKIAKAKTQIQLLEDQLKAFQDTEAKFLENGGVADFFNPTELERNINAMLIKIEALKKSLEGVVQKPEIGQLTGKDINIDTNLKAIPTSTEMQSAVQGMTKFNELRIDSIAATRAYNKELATEKDIVEGITQVVGGGLVNAFQSALSGGKSFVAALGDFLLQLVEKLLAAAAAAAILAAILAYTSFGSSAATGAAGAASTAATFGSLFSKFSGLKLASGGITTGPSLAMIGEGREKEAVIPLSKLDQFVSNKGGGDFTVEHRVQGSDLLLVINRAQKSQSRKS